MLRHSFIARSCALSTSLFVCVIAACGGGSSGTKTAAPSIAPPTPGVTRVATTAATAAATGANIRTLDLAAVSDVQAAVASSGGEFQPDTVIYGDLTGDGVDEAVVAINSGGNAGDIGFLVLTPRNAGTRTLFTFIPGTSVAIEVVDGKIVVTEPVPGPDDPHCCPSELKMTTYGWNGTTFIVESTDTEPNPAAGAKPTSSVNSGSTSAAAGLAPTTRAPSTGDTPPATDATSSVPRPPRPGSSP